MILAKDIKTADIEEILDSSTKLTLKMQRSIVLTLANVIEKRDQSTGEHVRKTASYVTILADELQSKGYYEEVDDQFVEDVISAAPLHDIGKVKISDEILNKPGRLTDEEFAEMQKHTLIGGNILDDLLKKVKNPGYLLTAKDVALYHHEKWDGTGYPYKLRGEEIPLSARIMAVADVFDALTSERSYKKAFPFGQALDIIVRGSGIHFDPLIVECFKTSIEDIYTILESKKT